MTPSSCHKGFKTKYLLISIAVLIIIWYIVSIIVDKQILVPTPLATFNILIEIVKTDTFLAVVSATMLRIILAFGIAFVLAVTLGMLAGLYEPINYLLKPIVTIFKSVPVMSIIILAIIWLDSELAPLLVAFLVTFPLLYQNVVMGIRNVDPKLVELVKVYQINKKKTVKSIYLPSIKSHLTAGVSTALGLNVRVVVAAEVLAQPRISIGSAMQLERALLNTSGVFAWSFIAIVIVGVFEFLLMYTQKNRKKASC